MCRTVGREYELLDAPLVTEAIVNDDGYFANNMLWKGTAAAIAVFAVFAALITHDVKYYAITAVCLIYVMIPSFIYEDIEDWFNTSEKPIDRELPNPVTLSALAVKQVCDEAFPVPFTETTPLFTHTVTQLITEG